MKNPENNKKNWVKPEVVVLSVIKETASGSGTNTETGGGPKTKRPLS